jgi:hypothetical protein
MGWKVTSTIGLGPKARPTNWPTRQANQTRSTQSIGRSDPTDTLAPLLTSLDPDVSATASTDSSESRPPRSSLPLARRGSGPPPHALPPPPTRFVPPGL